MHITNYLSLIAQPTYADVWDVLKQSGADSYRAGEEMKDRIKVLLAAKRFDMLEDAGLETVLEALKTSEVCPQKFSKNPKPAARFHTIKCDIEKTLKDLSTASRAYFENLSGVLKKFKPSEDLKKFLAELKINGGESVASTQAETSPINPSSLFEAPVHSSTTPQKAASGMPSSDCEDPINTSASSPPTDLPQRKSTKRASGMPSSDCDDTSASSPPTVAPVASLPRAPVENKRLQDWQQYMATFFANASQLSAESANGKTKDKELKGKETELQKGTDTNDTNFSKQLSQINSVESDEFMKILDTLFGKPCHDFEDVLYGHKGRNKKSQKYDYLYFVVPEMSGGIFAKIGMTSVPDISHFCTQYVRQSNPDVCIRFKLAHSTDGVPYFRKKMLESFVLDLVSNPRACRCSLSSFFFLFSSLRSRSISQGVRYSGR